jgi:Fe-S oxidoreductases
MRELEKEKYHMIGSHSAYKKCFWTHKALTENQYCYKGKFYGIESHRCVQMTPTSAWCWYRCIHCWRLEPEDIGIEWDETRLPTLDDPIFIVEKSIEEHKRAISGYFGREGVDKEMVKQAMTPKHVAISLTGEPTLYSKISELIREYHKRGMTTFLVTSGVRPDVLANLEEEPTQLFVSLQASSEEKYKIINRSIVPNGWSLFNKTLEILPSFSCPTVIRMTMIKGLNMSEEDINGFSRLISKAQPTYIEVKAYMHIGPSRNRLKRDNMPSHQEIKDFATKLAEKLGYNMLSEHVPSRIVLLSTLTKPFRFGNAYGDEGYKVKDTGDDESGEYGCTSIE